MGSPFFFVENVFSIAQFPLHLVTGNEEPAGNEAFRVADGRRSALDAWTSITLNAAAYLQTVCDRPRAANMVALDRGHNLGGKEVQLQCSDDGFTTVQTVADIVIPAASAPGSPDDAFGVVTEEGAWLYRFPARASYAWRLNVPAMGAGLKPKIVGLWLGLGYAPDYFQLPAGPGQGQLLGAESTSDAGWVGRGVVVYRRESTIALQLPSLFDYDDLARYHLEGHYAGAGRPMWVCFDDAQADRTFLAIAPLGKHGFARQPRWFYPAVELPYEEHEAVRN